MTDSCVNELTGSCERTLERCISQPAPEPAAALSLGSAQTLPSAARRGTRSTPQGVGKKKKKEEKPNHAIPALQAAWRFGDEGVVVPRLASSLKTLLANMRAAGDEGAQLVGVAGGAGGAGAGRAADGRGRGAGAGGMR